MVMRIVDKFVFNKLKAWRSPYGFLPKCLNVWKQTLIQHSRKNNLCFCPSIIFAPVSCRSGTISFFSFCSFDVTMATPVVLCLSIDCKAIYALPSLAGLQWQDSSTNDMQLSQASVMCSFSQGSSTLNTINALTVWHYPRVMLHTCLSSERLKLKCVVICCNGVTHCGTVIYVLKEY